MSVENYSWFSISQNSMISKMNEMLDVYLFMFYIKTDHIYAYVYVLHMHMFIYIYVYICVCACSYKYSCFACVGELYSE